MRKIPALLLIAVFTITLFACTDNGENDGRDYELEKGETPVTDRLELESDYENKDYVEMGENGPTVADGIGEVTLEACNDGDTAHFNQGDITITSRFVGIDTPESGHIIEEWGIAAGDYACDALRDADTIVLEREPEAGDKGTYGRFLSYVWVDGRLLNLEMVEQGFSPVSGVTGYKYEEVFIEARDNAKELGLRIHGEDDPMIPDDDAVDVTIQELVENPDDYMYKKVNVEGTVTNRIGNTSDGNGVFIQSHETDHAIYFNLGHDFSSSLEVGYKVEIDNARFAEDTKDFEGIHITDFSDADVSSPDDYDEGSITTHATPFEDLNAEQTARFFEYEGLTVADVNSEKNLFLVEDGAGHAMPVYQSDHIADSRQLDLENLTEGSTIDLEASLSVHEGELAFFISGAEAVTVTEEGDETTYYFPEDLTYDGPRLDEGGSDLPLYEEDGQDVTGGGGTFESDLQRCTDGDTAVFSYPDAIYSRIGNDAKSTRFLNINTPETYEGNYQEWGKTASVYVCEELTEAEAITLQTDPGDNLTGNFERLLAWVWYIPEGQSDYELLNYNTVRQGLGEVDYLFGAGETDVTTYDGKTYTEWMFDAEDDAKTHDRGMHGDLDSYYWDYEDNEPNSHW